MLKNESSRPQRVRRHARGQPCQAAAQASRSPRTTRTGRASTASIVQIDGQTVWSGTPNLNEGKCVANGTYNKALKFRWRQPCPQETSVHSKSPQPHRQRSTQLAVEVEDAAGHVAPSTTDRSRSKINSPRYRPTHRLSVLPPPQRSSLTAALLDEAAKLTRRRQPKTFTREPGSLGDHAHRPS